MAEVQGTCDPRFASVRAAFEERLQSGEDLGASIAIVIDGAPVADIWGGWSDPEHTRRWEKDTITNVWSTTKTMTALAALVLVDRGELDVHAKVSTYWPEFGANGKQDIEVRHLLSHTSGVSGWAQPVVVDDIYDRVSNVVPPPPLPIDFAKLDPNSAMFKTFTGPAVDASESWKEKWRRAEIAAANGHGNARSVARVQSVISNGGEVGGVRLLSSKTIETIFEEQSNGMDLVLGVPLRFGIGYGLPRLDTVPYIPEGRRCFWGGWGGSLIVNDLERRMTVAYMMNKMGPGLVGSPRSQAYFTACYETVGA